MKNQNLKIKSNMVTMPKGVFLTVLVIAFLFGDCQAVERVNKDRFKKYAEKVKKYFTNKEEEDAETGDDEI